MTGIQSRMLKFWLGPARKEIDREILLLYKREIIINKILLSVPGCFLRFCRRRHRKCRCEKIRASVVKWI